MKLLTFAADDDAARVRTARFEDRSSLPVSAACVVASGMRETLAAILHVPIVVRLLEPAIPSREGWIAIADGAALYCVRGNVCDAAIVLRPAEAIAIVAAAFDERPVAGERPRELSPLEEEVLERIVATVADTLTAVCGVRERERIERIPSIGDFVTYFEIVLESPLAARIGIALSRDSAPDPHGRLGIDDLGLVRLESVAELALTDLDAGALAKLRIGDVVAIRELGFRGNLRLAGRSFARGIVGARNGAYALSVESLS
ncbi:MAG: FliM/FliN family flagellar motor switch protein [Candidatus Eremiobacteraeota bacterium]|nr:FliM/FliN family flagellar motor switch protein [Candidatus Eremiobacteraeota bacterium]MBV8373094.1 FliM/FliN family flagellar motor switch protein [Candidatus Eremiobacteraeota bacterium]